MKEIRNILTLACALAACLPVAAYAASDPLGQPRADLATLSADAQAATSTVAADAKNSKIAQLKRDSKAGLLELKTDLKHLLIDATAARKAGADRKELQSLIQAARSKVKEYRSAVRSAFKQASKNGGSQGSSGNPSNPGTAKAGVIG